MWEEHTEWKGIPGRKSQHVKSENSMTDKIEQENELTKENKADRLRPY